MKGLLQSKRFLKNLGKWVCMYAGVMLLLTTVVTYSKYMTSLQANDSASTARFEISLMCVKSNGKDCNLDTTAVKVEENTVLAYEFSVDTSKMDVKSILKLLTFVDNSFIIENISRDGNVISKRLCENGNGTVCPTNSKMYIIDPINLPVVGKDKLTFTVEVKYVGNMNDLSTDITNPTKIENVLRIGYAVEQASA